MTRSNEDDDWFVHAFGPRIERLEACFTGHAYEPHRHDTYAIGLTLAGVQNFHYRGARVSSTPGHVMVIHPDERHDGYAGTPSGFRYQMIYVPPDMLQDILGGQPLPFIAGGIVNDPRLARCVGGLLRHVDATHKSFQEDDGLYDLAQALSHHGIRRRIKPSIDYRAAQRAKAYLDAATTDRITLADLEQASERSRWQLSRDFRAFFGTSPYRYLTMRRLDRAKSQLGDGVAISDAALASGFADQSHLTRQFKDAFGMSPGRWAALRSARKPN